MFDVLLYLLESSWAIQIHDMIYLAIYLIHMIFYFDPFKYTVSPGVLVNSNTYMIYLHRIFHHDSVKIYMIIYVAIISQINLNHIHKNQWLLFFLISMINMVISRP